jgi:hypothetical protein
LTLKIRTVWVRVPPPLLRKVADVQEKYRREGGCEDATELFYTNLYTSAFSVTVVGFGKPEHKRRAQLAKHRVVVPRG